MERRNRARWIVGCSLACLFLTAVLIVAVFGWPYYAPHVLELGRLHRGISVGDAADPIWAKATGYCERRAGGEAQCMRGKYTARSPPTWKCDDGRAPSGYIAVYDWVLMDDIQLNVQLDANDRVCASMFWAD